jgi:replicative DNA helicase|tara:strand:- start:1778 stop:3112 length:1335 start_codon:yes stop_codon:yes gene_type:complete
MEKPLPHSTEAEKSLLGCVLTGGNDVFDDARGLVTNERAFYVRENRSIWEAMIELFKGNDTIDTVTVIEKCKDMSKKVSSYYVTGLLDIPTSAQSNTYARIVWERYIQRQTAKSAYKLFNVSFDDYEKVAKLLEDHGKLVEELKDLHPTKAKSFAYISSNAMEMIKEGGNIIPFGLEYLDKPAGGMTRKEITVLGGRPGHGKTTLMVNIVKSLVNSKKKIMVFNREMSNTEMIRKLLVLESDSLLYSDVRRGKYRVDGNSWSETVKELESTHKSIMNKYNKYLTMYDDIRDIEETMREISRHKPDIVLDDYIQLIKVSGPTKDRRFELEDIMQEYKWICKKNNSHAILLSQLNRDIERRIDPRPRMSDYAESGVIEQTAETALFVFYGHIFDDHRFSKNEIEVISGKSRYGRPGAFKIGFLGNKCRFFINKESADTYEAKHLRN